MPMTMTLTRGKRFVGAVPASGLCESPQICLQIRLRNRYLFPEPLPEQRGSRPILALLLSILLSPTATTTMSMSRQRRRRAPRAAALPRGRARPHERSLAAPVSLLRACSELPSPPQRRLALRGPTLPRKRRLRYACLLGPLTSFLSPPRIPYSIV